VGLADALIHDPPILIMDEPTAGLDPIQIRETLAFIKQLGENHTILLSTHILSEVEAVCERVIIINAGRIGFSRRLADLERTALILLEVRGPVDAVAGALRGVNGVAQVSARPEEDGVVALEVRTHEDRDLREALAQAVAHKGWPLRRLERQRQKLEDAFFDVLRKADPLKEGDGKTAVSEAVKDLAASGRV
jgi:ABC-2 type transport system ATP-binding protein